MIALTTQDLHRVVRNIPSDLRGLMRSMSENDGPVLFIAGGFVREVVSSGKAQDIDVFGPSQEVLERAADDLYFERRFCSERKLHKSKYATSVFTPPRMPVQFIHRWLYNDPLSLLSQLDFTVCQAAVWFYKGEWQSACSELFYSDLAARRLRYTFPARDEEAGGSLMRVRKFLPRGWNIQVESLAGVVSRLVGGVKEEKLSMFTKEGLSQEQARTKVLRALLHEVDPLVIIDGVEPKDEENEL